ncbi:MAG: alpha/beta hydrolase [Bacteroidales bacterium]
MVDPVRSSGQKELKQDGYSIYYYARGDKQKELIVMLHPAFADHRCFDHQADHFAKEYRLVTVDLPGHGLSKTREKIDGAIHHIDAILKEEGTSKAHFVGVSLGALIAQYYALHYPEKIRSLTVLGGYDINTNNKEITQAQRSESIRWIVKALFSMNSFRRHVASVSVVQPAEQDRLYEMAGLFTRRSFACMTGLGKIVKKRDAVIRNYPLLILSGDQDIDLAKRIGRDWHDREPGSRFQLIENAGHCANMDNPGMFNRVVMEFIQRGV